MDVHFWRSPFFAVKAKKERSSLRFDRSFFIKQIHRNKKQKIVYAMKYTVIYQKDIWFTHWISP